MPRYVGKWSADGPTYAIEHSLSIETMATLNEHVHAILAVAGVHDPDDFALALVLFAVLNAAERSGKGLN